MNNLKEYIQEKLIINKNIKAKVYNYFPKTTEELHKILNERLSKDKNADLNDIDVSAITNMDSLFFRSNIGDIDLSRWNVSNVKSMNNMFYECKNFTGKGLENWDVKNVIEMNGTFAGCTNFNGNVSNWNISKCTNIGGLFCRCPNFNANLSKWDVSNVTNMINLFNGCTSFTGEGLENWNPLHVKEMNNIFGDCPNLKNKPSWYKE